MTNYGRWATTYYGMNTTISNTNNKNNSPNSNRTFENKI